MRPVFSHLPYVLTSNLTLHPPYYLYPFNTPFLPFTFIFIFSIRGIYLLSKIKPHVSSVTHLSFIVAF